MTPRTRPTAAPDTVTVRLLTSTPLFWSLVAAIAAMLVVLTGWTAAQAQAIDAVVDGNGPSHPSLRQLEREAGRDASQHPSIRQLERVAQADEPVPVSVRQVERAEELRRTRMAQLEAAEVRRFANAAARDDVARGDQARGELVGFTDPTPEELTRMEHSELRRFRNRAPAEALAPLDEAIALLAAALA